MLGSRDTERVAELMRETAAAELLPRFRSLAKEDIRSKRPGELVTVADEAAERRLAAGLARILPGVPVVGEEAVESDPGLVDLVGRPEESCWIVDPLDGTNNFAAGRDKFAIIVCLVRNGVSVAGWILDVPRGHMAIAVKGEGTTVDGRRVRASPPKHPLVGFVGHKVRKEFERQVSAERRAALGRLKTMMCAGLEYHELLAGRADFNMYRVTRPWDHAAGTLMVSEAGGRAERFDGEAYGPGHADTRGLIAASVPETIPRVREIFEAARLPLLSWQPPG